MSPEKREFNKTPLMRKIETAFCADGQTIEDLLKQEYDERKKSTHVLAANWRAADISISDTTVLNWSKRFDIPIHNDKRAQGIKESWERLSTEEKSLKLVPFLEGTKKASRARMVARLGEDPEQALKSLAEEGLSVREIAEKKDEKFHNIRSWLRKEKIKTNRTTTLDREDIEARENLIRWARILKLMQYLNPIDCLVVDTRYPGGGKIIPLEEVGSTLKITRERARQRDARARTTLEKMLLGELVPKNGIAKLPRKKTTKPILQFDPVLS